MKYAAAVQLSPQKMQGYSTGRPSNKAKQKQSLYSGTVAHMKNIT